MLLEKTTPGQESSSLTTAIPGQDWLLQLLLAIHKENRDPLTDTTLSSIFTRPLIITISLNMATLLKEVRSHLNTHFIPLNTHSLRTLHWAFFQAHERRCSESTHAPPCGASVSGWGGGRSSFCFQHTTQIVSLKFSDGFFVPKPQPLHPCSN